MSDHRWNQKCLQRRKYNRGNALQRLTSVLVQADGRINEALRSRLKPIFTGIDYVKDVTAKSHQ